MANILTNFIDRYGSEGRFSQSWSRGMLSSMRGQVNERRGVVATTKRLLLKYRDCTGLTGLLV
jgi:hypothetical protein